MTVIHNLATLATLAIIAWGLTELLVIHTAEKLQDKNT